jgi:HlyD family secretion protein
MSTSEKSEENEGARAAAPSNGKPGVSPIRIIVPLLLLVVIAASAVWYFFLRGDGAPANVIIVSGRIESDDSAVAVKTSGRIREITVREGDPVKAGQVIAILDDDQVQARVEQAESAVTQAETRVLRAEQQVSVLREQKQQAQIGVRQSGLDAQGRVKQAEAQVSEARSRVAQSEAQLAQAEVNLRQARDDAGKYERLSSTGDVPEQRATQARSNAESLEKVVEAQKKQVETARAALAAAQGSLSIARASLENPGIRASQSSAVQKQIEQAESDIEAARADADAARAKLREAEANRSDLNVVAPFDGVVATRTAEPGEVVTAGTTIVTILNPGIIYLRAFVPEGQIGKVKVGQKARVYLDSSPSTPIDAEVARIDPEATFTPENTYFKDERVKQVVGVKLMIRAPEGGAKPGMPADGEILTSGEWAGGSRAE